MVEKNPLVFMDVSIKKAHVGRMIFELFKDVAPATVENFRALCTGEKGIGDKTDLPLHYKGSYFYKIHQGYVKGGDFFSHLGTCGESIYGEKFPNEMPQLTHDEPGLLSMNICDRYGIGSHFIITLKPDQDLDRFHVVFGKIVCGLETLDEITEAPWGGEVQVSNCGEYNLDESIATLWDAITSKHHSRFRILYQLACLSYPQVGGDILCEAAKKKDLTVMNDLLKQGLNVDSGDRHGSTASQVAMAENHVEMVMLLILNGAYVPDIQNHDFSASALNEMLRKCKTRHRITVHEATPSEK